MFVFVFLFAAAAATAERSCFSVDLDAGPASVCGAGQFSVCAVSQEQAALGAHRLSSIAQQLTPERMMELGTSACGEIGGVPISGFWTSRRGCSLPSCSSLDCGENLVVPPVCCSRIFDEVASRCEGVPDLASFIQPNIVLFPNKSMASFISSPVCQAECVKASVLLSTFNGGSSGELDVQIWAWVPHLVIGVLFSLTLCCNFGSCAKFSHLLNFFGFCVSGLLLAYSSGCVQNVSIVTPAAAIGLAASCLSILTSISAPCCLPLSKGCTYFCRFTGFVMAACAGGLVFKYAPQGIPGLGSSTEQSWAVGMVIAAFFDAAVQFVMLVFACNFEPPEVDPNSHRQPFLVPERPAVPVLVHRQLVVQPKANVFIVLFVLDVSGSMAGDKFEAMCAGVQILVNSLTKHDLVGAITFNDQIQVLAGLESATTSSLPRKLRQVKCAGGTALYDAIANAYALINLQDQAIRARLGSAGPIQIAHKLIIVTDGEDGHSTKCNLQTIRGMFGRFSNVLDTEVLMVGVGLTPRYANEMRHMVELGEPNCAFANISDSQADLEKMFQRITFSIQQRTTLVGVVR